MKDKVLDILEDMFAWAVAIVLYGGAFVLLAFGIICLSSMRVHGSGEMDIYVTKVERFGDRVFVEGKDSLNASNKYSGCAASNEEQKFKDAIGKKVRVKWNEVFSLAPFWTECPGPVQIDGAENDIMKM